MKNAIKAVKVVKHFGGIKAVDGISLNVHQGSIFGLLGPNGAGKTTLLRAMTTLHTIDSGELIIGGINVSNQPNEVRKIIGLAGQSASVDGELTGRENIEMVGRLYHIDKEIVKERTEDILRRLSLVDAADRPAKTYSGGMRRRLDLGASLVGRPKILFLDEPTTGLDPRTRFEMWDYIRTLNEEGTTILLTTQYLEEVDELADYIALIDHGKLITQGTAEELKGQLGDDVVEITLGSAKDGQAALSIVNKTAKKTPQISTDKQKITVPVSDGSKSLLKIVRALDNAKLDPTEVSLHRPTLDDVFLKLTGKATTEGAGNE